MRKKIVAGNWKMNTVINEGVALAAELDKLVAGSDTGTVVVIAPPFTHLSAVSASVDTSRIHISAQNCAYEPKGAFTGEVSAGMLKSLGCSHCIIGHSERRIYFGETNVNLAKKARLLLDSGITPVFCCGEILKEREEGRLFDVIKNQVSESLFGFSKEDFSKIIIAYEPVWAIGTGVVATPRQAQEMHEFIRLQLSEKYGEDTARATSILYGGSCNSSNAKELFQQPDIDGGLIGGASLKADDFFKIITSF